MSVWNTREVQISTFFLIGIPGMEHAHMWVSIPIGLTHLIPSWGTAASSFSYRRRPLCRSLCTIPSPCWPFLTSDCPSLFQPCRESSCSMPLEFPRMPALHRVFHSWICTYGVIISPYCVHGSLHSHPHSELHLQPDQC